MPLTALLSDFWSRPQISFVNWLWIDFLRSTCITHFSAYIFEVIWLNYKLASKRNQWSCFMQRNRLESGNLPAEVIMQIYALFCEQFRVCVSPSVLPLSPRLWAKSSIHLGRQLVAHWIDNMSKSSYRRILLAWPTMSTVYNVWVVKSLPHFLLIWSDFTLWMVA